MSKDLITKTKVALLPIISGEIQSMEEEVSSGKPKPDIPMTLMKLYLSLLNCFNILEYIWWLLNLDL